MEIEYKSTKLEKECNDLKASTKSYGKNCAKLLLENINFLIAADSLKDIENLRFPHLHWLKVSRQSQCAIYLEHPKRLLIEPLETKSKDFKNINKIKILEIIDYH
ncbi:MAG: hypothetical protein A2X61_12860 [Ignavibacteria bacterium GWB2_35_12]|nr:MAG: hypothetical protein A2X63_03775 [Ignavibacteria bacterium GWA2_35_8]OGU41514.1 MAG: hypothetical protein A2X61_12860 [Ignavibacteria bacterium GWB2_35_12]OGU93001.1 MAG: hypothetical protein A2220_15785 [Ignavibacteria bacterium RIFOXYA2_FULL_35_10]OGV22988.1 MAG: hypothetical protein A2475_10330 [Ignavibacteria bacterium RIFOXYC2_FULL_35_21]